ncbi:MAG TPA: glycine zipper 2TM domain-containing protein [Rhodocyclaceae bacterium]|nr:glycine zipper 2TM domain-containing protein [Rhodocyclaceae bacterium]HMV53592.1 glycine zipper 2TM domain-containing protein [Rhodocyclaceae bacterium]HMZ83217.1 glycine zipper 2TM domain-containing protein [Rhodocyclaceae bacterium]HNA02826.1 glycine zipper 2TM domain-containing protein [Rhodocyclaceae bacterium]HNB77966.1 glycine zipper 2TM domain-containing protein [Rhodocyclaceae bacterium]
MPQPDAFSRPSPLMNIAAVAVIIASVTAIAAITGLLPSAFSHKSDDPVALSSVNLGSNAPTAVAAPCRQCGVVESVRQVQVKGAATGVGAVAGGLTGAIVGSQFGRGNGRTAMGVAGAAGGAYAGHEIEKNLHTTTTYRVVVRMENGAARTVYQSEAPAFGVGEKVRVINGALAAQG